MVRLFGLLALAAASGASAFYTSVLLAECPGCLYAQHAGRHGDLLWMKNVENKLVGFNL
jgi:hypothetical protein